MKKKYSVVILAAGKSSRMGMPKFLLKYDENTTFLEHIIKKYEAFGCEQIVVVLNEEGANIINSRSVNFLDKVTLITNNHPEWERFYSIKLGLKALNEENLVFIHNVDNPFVNPVVLASLIENIFEFDYAVPTYKGRGGHPVLLSEKVILAIIEKKENNLNFKDYLSNYRKVIVKVNDKNILVNVNSKEEYNTLFH